MTEIQLDVQPGFVAAFYFIVFDLIALSLIDFVLARGVNVYYYRRIMNGYPINVRSVDIPGVTSFLVDRFYTPISVGTTLIKLGFFAMFFFADLEISSRLTRSSTTGLNTAQLFFNTSREAFLLTINVANKTVVRQRAWERSRSCYVQDGDTLTYYPISFNFSDRDQSQIDFSSIRCMTPPIETSVAPATVVGCSTFMASHCEDESLIALNNTFVPPLENSRGRIALADLMYPPVSYIMEVFEWERTKLTFPDYVNSTVFCVRTRIGLEHQPRPEYTNCLVYMLNNSLTLIELWTLKPDGLYLERKHPGPLFEGQILIGDGDALKLLSKPLFEANWKHLSGALVADTVEEAKIVQQFSFTTDTGVVTVLSPLGWALAPIPLLVGILLRIVVYVYFKKDFRPQINSIDGLSSIVREEQEPTGRSIDQGRTAIVGLYMRGNSAIRFGPVRDKSETTRAPNGAQFF